MPPVVASSSIVSLMATMLAALSDPKGEWEDIKFFIDKCLPTIVAQLETRRSGGPSGQA